ncbi:type II toxin-antitoxin system ParD family antitoxin [Rhizorhapis suberifaciens]|uniref:Antitoxin ParD1/3/4 n=1 Tax=Rhizorhapis suberifaciens TaxID=13656 RepID=A0A840HTN5_9SPHN|nr:type II toxin-antitoxin system ParD family antitoxin [Rhizorhapis suberifaciens]MBB4640854.1 antitoxin ParD1/3/4 [Rhizorhapis suberifaciens]
MTERSSKPVTVTLGGMAERAQKLVDSGRYASISEVVRAGLRALDREEATLDALLKAKLEEALADPRPPVPMDEAFARIRAGLDRKI